ncbi:MAG: glycosyltransferase family 4 protein, partial [Candidatus Berkelbacteria bacterium]|nr:glycosyltransferase family 4 protein [Candidatus Berkelbacteria bacterium]
MRKLDDLRVAIIHDWLSTLGGAEHVLLALHQIFPKAPIYTSVYNEDELPQFKNAKIITSFVNNLPYGKKKPQIYLPFLPTVFENFDLSEFDLVISNCHCVSKGVITKPET